MIVEKCVILGFYQLEFWKKVKEIILLPFHGHPRVEVVIVVLVVPFVMNVSHSDGFLSTIAQMAFPFHAECVLNLGYWNFLHNSLWYAANIPITLDIAGLIFSREILSFYKNCQCVGTWSTVLCGLASIFIPQLLLILLKKVPGSLIYRIIATDFQPNMHFLKKGIGNNNLLKSEILYHIRN